MEQTAGTVISLDDSFARDLPALAEPWDAARAPAPELLVLNDAVAVELGLDPAALRSPDGVAFLVGNSVPEGARPVAQAYAGHQFGGLSPRLGDGRALLLGEVVDIGGRRRDLHLKGSGRTPFARGGDGKAAVGPMLREYVMGEAMAALGVPTTRALAVVATGERIARDTMLPGAVLARVAASHLRVGSFQYAAMQPDTDLVRDLADHAIDRHYPQVADAPQRYLAFFEAVVEAQASLVAQWMAVGFIHGVMNTDNMTISGETIDYGPCAFLEAYDPTTVFSSIDHGGRYAFGNQPGIAQWNLARLAEPLLPLLDPDTDHAVALATDVLTAFPQRYLQIWRRAMRSKLGFDSEVDAQLGERVDALTESYLALLHANGVDYTLGFRELSSAVRGDEDPLRTLFAEPDAPTAWLADHSAAVATQGSSTEVVGAAMDEVNPRYIARNHQVEAALEAATAGDLDPFRRLVEVVAHPFDEQPGREAYAQPAPDSFGPYQTFCGT